MEKFKTPKTMNAASLCNETYQILSHQLIIESLNLDCK